MKRGTNCWAGGHGNASINAGGGAYSLSTVSMSLTSMECDLWPIFFIPMTNNVYTHCHTRHVWITDGLTNGLISETWRRWSCNWMSLAYSMSSAIQISKSFLRNRWSGWEAFFICFAFFPDGRQAAGGERGAGPVSTRFARRPSFVCRMCGRTHGAIYSLSSMCRVLTVTWLCVKCFGKQECRYVANVVFPPSLWPDLELNSK